MFDGHFHLFFLSFYLNISAVPRGAFEELCRTAGAAGAR